MLTAELNSPAGPVDIAMLLPSAQGGGAERVFLQLAAAFAERNYRVELLLAQDREAGCEPRGPANLHTIRFGRKRVLGVLMPLVRYLKTRQPAVLMSTLTYVNVVAVIAHWLAAHRGRVILREAVNLVQLSALRKNYRDTLLPLLAARTYRHADRIIAVSESVAQDLVRDCRLPPSRITVIYNPVATQRIRALSRAPVPENDHRTEGPRLVTIGRLSREKDHATLLQAFAMVRDRLPVTLDIVGEGEERGALERQRQTLGLEADVRLLGHQDNPYPWLAAADLFVLSSRVEGLPNVLLEAMACGLPIVATDCPSGPREILADGKWGRLVPPQAPRQLADAILAALQDPARPEYGEALARYDPDRVVAQYLDTALPAAGAEESH